MEKVKVLVVGLGYMGDVYLRNLREQLTVDAANIIGMDIVEENITKTRAKFLEIRLVNSFDEVNFSEITMGFVLVNTPSHAKVLIELMNRGVRHLLCEKPLAMKLSSVSEIEKKAEETGSSVFIAHLMNFSPAVLHLQKKMQKEGLILTEGSVVWGKNRMGDARPTPGDLEDEMLHGRGILNQLVKINQTVEHRMVSGILTFPEFVNSDAQKKARELDISFPEHPNASTMVLEKIITNRTVANSILHSSFLYPCQTRRVSCVLSRKESPKVPVYSAEMNFDIKAKFGSVDHLKETELNVKQIKELEFPTNKILEQIRVFINVSLDGNPDNRLACLEEARSAVSFFEAVEKSHLHNMMPT